MRPLRLICIAFTFSFFLSTTYAQYGQTEDLASLAPVPSMASAPSAVTTVKYTLNITVGNQSPDCFARPVILVNGRFGNATIEVVQGQILEVLVLNNLPPDFPTVIDGISIHWHGLDQRGNEWYDGVAAVTQCPIGFGANFTYRFQVNDQPGTYLWHGHAGLERDDGLEGALIVRPPGTDVLKELYNYDEEVIIRLTDWYHDLFSPLAYAVSRPFDSSKATNQTGNYSWINNPQSVLINYRGNWRDCQLGPAGSTINPTCNVTVDVVPPGRSDYNPGASALLNQGCQHYSLQVDPGKKYRLRIINFSGLLSLTFGIEGHPLQIIAADATPINPITKDFVDVNSGQRYDVILTANASVPRTYYLEAFPQYRAGAVAGFGFLKYSNQPNLTTLPPTATPPSNFTAPWSIDDHNAITTADWLVSPGGNSSTSTSPSPSVSATSVSPSSISPSVVSQLAGNPNRRVPGNVTVQILLNVSQPILSKGQLHWAFNNVATYLQPSCTSLLGSLYAEKQGYLSSNQLAAAAPAKDISLQQYSDSSEPVQVFVYGNPGSNRVLPVSGSYIVELKYGDVVEVIMQNNPGNYSGGDSYLVSAAASLVAGRGNQEQHPIHLHGHHFWSIGSGLGNWNSSSLATYNLNNPAFRDTFTLPRGGWHALRFVADNPGVWELHCHLPIHFNMGQRLTFAEAIDRVSDPPPDMPTCPDRCIASFAGWNQTYVAAKYGNSGFV